MKYAAQTFRILTTKCGYDLAEVELKSGWLYGYRDRVPAYYKKCVAPCGTLRTSRDESIAEKVKHTHLSVELAQRSTDIILGVGWKPVVKYAAQTFRILTTKCGYDLAEVELKSGWLYGYRDRVPAYYKKCVAPCGTLRTSRDESIAEKVKHTHLSVELAQRSTDIILGVGWKPVVKYSALTFRILTT